MSGNVDGSGVLVAPEVLTAEQVARLKAGWVLHWSRELRFDGVLVLQAPAQLTWVRPAEHQAEAVG
jgi:hypothetical protein